MQFPTPGETFEGRYQIESVLGSGGFARVYRCTELGLGRPVALKLLKPPVVDSQSDSQRDDYLETLMGRFRREAQLLSQLRSPYTVTMYQYGQTEAGLLYMALEFVDGLSLAEVLRDGRPVAEDRVVKILKQVLMSLKEAHALGMLHRDLKPANIMLFDHMDDRDQAKLLDFGIAKTLGDSAARKDLTSDGTLIGTPRYMAPEQIQGANNVGPASDIYALGLVGYELLVGQRAILGDNSIQIIGKQLNPRSFQLPETVNCSASLRAIINRMIAKNLDARYSDVGQVIDDLEGENIPYLQIEPLPIGFQDSSEISFELPRPSVEEVSSSRIPIAAFVGALISFAVIVGLALALTHDDNEATAQTQVPPVIPEPVFEEPVVEPTETLVASNRAGVIILVNGDEVGPAPIKINPKRLPAVITAKLGDDTRTATLKERQSSLVLTFPEPPASANVAIVKAPVKKAPNKTRKSTKRSRKKNGKGGKTGTGTTKYDGLE